MISIFNKLSLLFVKLCYSLKVSKSLPLLVRQPNMTGSFLLSSTESAHTQLVREMMETWAGTNNQVRLITEDGQSMWCGRMLLVMYSRRLRDLLLMEDQPTSISLPMSSSELGQVMELLQTGVVKTSSEEECESIAAILSEVLGVDSPGLQVEDNKPRKQRIQKNKIKKEKVEAEEEVFPCQFCGQLFVKKNDLRKHMHEHTGPGTRFDCPECGSSFARKDKLNVHFRVKHEKGGIVFPCNICDKVLSRKDKVKEHVRRKHPGQL